MSGPPTGDRPDICDWADGGARYWRDVYDDPGIDGAIYRLRQQRVIAAFEAADPPAGSRVLELGPGAGLVTVELARRGHHVVCLDPAAAMLENTSARARAEGLGERVETIVGDAQSLPFDDAGFGVVVAVGVLPWLEDPPAALREVKRVLAPGAAAVLTSDNRARLCFLLDPRLSPLTIEAAKRVDGVLVRGLGVRSRRRTTSLPRRYTNQQVDRMLADAGLVNEYSASVGFGPFTLLRRRVVPARWEVGVNARLQRLADSGLPGVRGRGAHYVVVARSPTV
jgi:ubiquinone/menaquinone biosynthesis C-methylase UbiE